MNLTYASLTHFENFSPFDLLGNKANIPRNAYFILINECFHTHKNDLCQLSKSILTEYGLWHLFAYLCGYFKMLVENGI